MDSKNLKNDVLFKRMFAYWMSARKQGWGHHKLGEFQEKKNRYLGIVAMVISIVVSSALFGSLQQKPDVVWQIATGFVSLAGVVISSLIAFLNYPSLAIQHKAAGVKYGSIRRELDVLMTHYCEATDIDDKKVYLDHIETIAKEFDRLAGDSPQLPERIYNLAKSKAEAQLKEEGLWWEEFKLIKNFSNE